MRKKILVLSIYPAPYRVELIEKIAGEFDVTVFYERNHGHGRDKSWFLKGEYFLLDTTEGKEAYKKACKALKSYDLVILYDYSTKTAVKLIERSRMYRIPYVINADGVALIKHGNPFREILKKMIISGAAGCLSSGEKTNEYFYKYGAKIAAVHTHTFSSLQEEDILTHVLTPADKGDLREKLDLGRDKKLAIAVGRFLPYKKFDQLITAWKTLPSEYELLIIGGGEEEENYRRIIADNHISNVRLEGFFPKEKLILYYKACDVFIHPASYEVWGLVVNEAMACGLPVVVSDRCIAGLELIFQGQNGYLFPHFDYEKMIDYVKKILDDEELKRSMSFNALKSIKNYTIENMAKCQIEALRNIIKSN